MKPTVDLVIDSSTGKHGIDIVAEVEGRPVRIPLAPEEAAKMSADLCTVLAFSIKPTEVLPQERMGPVAVPDVEEEPEVEVEEEESGEVTEHLRPLSWHRKDTGQYETLIETERGKKTKVTTFKARDGWNILIGGKRVNRAAISSKREAYNLVEQMRAESAREISV